MSNWVGVKHLPENVSHFNGGNPKKEILKLDIQDVKCKKCIVCFFFNISRFPP